MGSCCQAVARVRCVGARWRLPATLTFLGFVLTGLFSGCGPDTGGRLPLAGKVAFRGAPLDNGTIEFTDGKNQSGTTIAKGAFTIPAEKGLPPGKYTVRISSVQESGSGPPGPPGPEAEKQVAKELIPAEYNTKSQLTTEITSAGSKNLSFDLK